MNDLISRQAAIDALRYAQHRFTVADEAGGIGTVKWSEDVIYFAAAKNVLADLPSAEPEIIHCRDCEYGEIDQDNWWFCTNLGCQVGEPDGSGFCADAEKRR